MFDSDWSFGFRQFKSFHCLLDVATWFEAILGGTVCTTSDTAVEYNGDGSYIASETSPSSGRSFDEQ